MLNEGPEALEDHYNDDYLNCFGVFQCSGVEEVVLPSTLRDVGQKTFLGCASLRTIYAKRGCRADLSRPRKPETVAFVSQ